MGTCTSKPKVAPEGQKIFFVLGGPGSGKGTVCTRLIADFGFKHLSAGDLLREETKERPDSDLSKEINEHLKNGTLVPFTVIVPLLKNKIDELSKEGHLKFLIDGFPRATEQGKAFEKQVAKPTHVLFLDCSEETMKVRLLKRGETSGRVDDNEETIIKRFQTFKTQSLPVVQYYRKSNIVSTIDGNGSPDETYALVKKAVEAAL